MNKPKIYCFLNNRHGLDGIAYAIAEDGICLASHFCSNEYFAFLDLGVKEGYSLDTHEFYKKHYPDGYEMEFVCCEDILTHSGLLNAIELNKLQAEKEAIKE